MALNYRGQWRHCENYEADDVSYEAGELWKATQQNAGKKPSENNPNIWVRLNPEEKEEIRDDIINDPDVPDSAIDIKHDETKDIKVLHMDSDPYHVSEDEAKALLNANSPSESNPVITKDDLTPVGEKLDETKDKLDALKHDDLDDIKSATEGNTFHVSENEANALANAENPSADNPVITKSQFDEVTDELKEANLDLKNRPHDDMNGIHSFAGGTYHVAENEAKAINKTKYYPDEDNPFITKMEMPLLENSLSPFEEMRLADGIGLIYDGVFDEVSKTLGVCGDNFIAWYSDKDDEWTVQEVQGAWRAICAHGRIWVAVGSNCAAAGAVGEVAIVPIRDGKYTAITSSGGRVMAVGDGKVAWSDSGTGDWRGIDTTKGYGEGICYHEIEGKFYAVGSAGLRSTKTGQVWDAENFVPGGSWRDIARGEHGLYACSGRIAYKIDEGDALTNNYYWQEERTAVGGLNGIAEGEGYVVAVANGHAFTTDISDMSFVDVEVPDYVYTSIVFGASRFWLLGSAICVSLVKNVKNALAGADAPNGSNPFTTLKTVREIANDTKDDVSNFVNDKIKDVKIFWQSNIVEMNGAVFAVESVDTENSLSANLDTGKMVIVKDSRRLIFIYPDGEKVYVGGVGSGENNPNKGLFQSKQELSAAYPVAERGDFATVIEQDQSTVYLWDSGMNDWKATQISGVYVMTVNGKAPVSGNVQLAPSDIGAAPAADTVQFDSHGNVNLTQGRGNNIILKYGKAYEGVLAGNEIANVAKIDAIGTRLGNTYVSTVIESNTRPKVALPNDEERELAYKGEIPEISSLFATPEQIEAGETEGKIPPFSYVKEIAEKAENASAADVFTGTGQKTGDIITGETSFTINTTLAQAQQYLKEGDKIKLINADGETFVATIAEISESDGKVYITTNEQLDESFNNAAISVVQPSIEYATTTTAGFVRLAAIPQ